MKKCKKCGRRTTGSTCSNEDCNDSDIVDDIIDIGTTLVVGSVIDNIFDSGSSGSSDSSSSSSSSVDFGGGDFGGGGAGSDW